MPEHLKPLFFILPVIGFLFIGLWLMVFAAKRLASLCRQAQDNLPKEAVWSVANELSMAFILANGAFFFAFHCLRGSLVIAAAALVLTCVTSAGSHFRYRQILQTVTLKDNLRKQLLSVHIVLATGLFFTIGPQLALILIFLRYTRRL